MSKQRTFLSRGLFEKDFMQTRIKSHRISKAEKWLGYAIGPGFAMVHFFMVSSLRERFYMQINVLNDLFNNPMTYGTMNTVANIIGVLLGLYINYMVERTVSKAGRFRPYVLIGALLMAVFGVFMFWSPFPFGTAPQLVWLYFVNIIYTGVAVNMFNMKNNVVSVSTRNVLERSHITSWTSSISNMIPGVVLMFVVDMMLWNSVLIPNVTGEYWMLLVLITGVLGFVGALLQYFFTRERITEDNRMIRQEEAKEEGKPSLSVGQQLKYMLTNKYFLMGVLVMAGAIFYDYMQGSNSRVYMIQYILGDKDGSLQGIFLMVTMQPMMLGMIFAPMLAKKFSARKIMGVSAVIVFVGIAIAMIAPSNLGAAMGGGFIFACGIFAVTTMYFVFGQMAADEIEHKHGFRVEGTLANAIVVAVNSILLTPASGLYETGLSLFGFKAPANLTQEAFAALAETDYISALPIEAGLDAGKISVVFAQNEAVNNWILTAYYGSYAIFAAIVLVVCVFFTLDKKIPLIRADLENRKKAAAEARGEVYFTPEELDRIEMEAAAKELEESRIAELKAKCAKKGLDFHTENQKYLDAQAAKQAKAAKKTEKVKK